MGHEPDLFQVADEEVSVTTPYSLLGLYYCNVDHSLVVVS